MKEKDISSHSNHLSSDHESLNKDALSLTKRPPYASLDSEEGEKPLLTEEEVLEYLENNPRFIFRHRELIAIPTHINNALTDEDVCIHERDLGSNVTDLQAVMVRYLRQELQHTEHVYKNLQKTARDNLRDFRKIMDIVVEFMHTPDLAHAVHYIENTIPKAFDTEACVLVTQESARSYNLDQYISKVLTADIFEEKLNGRNIVLKSNSFGDGNIFGSTAPLLRSWALVRIHIHKDIPAFIAFGSSDPDDFNAEQSTDVLNTLAKVIERVLVWHQAATLKTPS